MCIFIVSFCDLLYLIWHFKTQDHSLIKPSNLENFSRICHNANDAVAIYHLLQPNCYQSFGESLTVLSSVTFLEHSRLL